MPNADFDIADRHHRYHATFREVFRRDDPKVVMSILGAFKWTVQAERRRITDRDISVSVDLDDKTFDEAADLGNLNRRCIVAASLRTLNLLVLVITPRSRWVPSKTLAA